MNPTPLFLISLPRSGSTFLQKILMSHSAIASSAEPWFLLPLFYMLRKQGVWSEYGHPTAVEAYHRISKEAAGVNSEYDRIRSFAESIYQQTEKPALFFQFNRINAPANRLVRLSKP